MNAVLGVNMDEIKDNSTTLSNTINKYGKHLLSFIKRKVYVLEDAEDILQDVLYQLSKLTDLDEIENAGAWLYSVSKNKITDFYRKKKTGHLEDYTYEDEDGDFSIRDVLLLDNSQNPELTLFQDVFWEELMKSLDELPENQKLVFVQNELEGRKLQEIADAQGENLKTIISRKGYAIKYLRKKLLPLYEELYH